MARPSYLGCARVLKGRTIVIYDSWKQYGFERPEITPLLRILQAPMDYATPYFLPDDLLTDYINDDTYDFSVIEVIEAIEEEYPKVDLNSILRIVPHATIGEFARAILRPTD